MNKTNNNIRAFTIRLQEDESNMLLKLRRELNINTDSGVIKYLISNYSELNHRYLSEMKKRNKAELKLSEVQIKLDNIKEVFKSIIND